MEGIEMKKTILGIFLICSLALAMGGDPNAKPGWNDLVYSMFIGNPYLSKNVVQTPSEKTNIVFDSMYLGYGEKENEYTIAINHKRLDETVGYRNIEYVIEFYNDYGEVISLSDGSKNYIAVHNAPSYVLGSAHGEWDNFFLKERPTSLKVWVKRHLDTRGNTKKFM